MLAMYGGLGLSRRGEPRAAARPTPGQPQGAGLTLDTAHCQVLGFVLAGAGPPRCIVRLWGRSCVWTWHPSPGVALAEGGLWHGPRGDLGPGVQGWAVGLGGAEGESQWPFPSGSQHLQEAGATPPLQAHLCVFIVSSVLLGVTLFERQKGSGQCSRGSQPTTAQAGRPWDPHVGIRDQLREPSLLPPGCPPPPPRSPRVDTDGRRLLGEESSKG